MAIPIKVPMPSQKPPATKPKRQPKGPPTGRPFRPGNKIGTPQQKARAGRIGKSRSPWRHYAAIGVLERDAKRERRL